MSKFAEQGLPCPCGVSSDAYCIDHEGVGFCFSCGEPDVKINRRLGIEDTKHEVQINEDDVSHDYVKHRGLSRKTVEHYGIMTNFVKGEEYSWTFPYVNGVSKIKRIGNVPRGERYRWHGNPNECGLFGKDKFLPGSKKTVVVTEGEHDAPSFYEILGGSVASVSVQSSSCALRDITIDRDYLNSFERIVFAFDNDEPGQAALKK